MQSYTALVFELPVAGGDRSGAHIRHHLRRFLLQASGCTIGPSRASMEVWLLGRRSGRRCCRNIWYPLRRCQGTMQRMQQRPTRISEESTVNWSRPRSAELCPQNRCLRKVWWLVLWPMRGIPSARCGAGYEPYAQHPVAAKQAYAACNWLQRGLALVRQWGFTPLRWHRSCGAALKKNSTP